MAESAGIKNFSNVDGKVMICQSSIHDSDSYEDARIRCGIACDLVSISCPSINMRYVQPFRSPFPPESSLTSFALCGPADLLAAQIAVRRPSFTDTFSLVDTF